MDININTFDILDLARYKHGNYLVVKNQEIDFLNLAMSDLEAREKGMKAALDFLSEPYEERVWEKAKHHIVQLSETREVRRYISSETSSPRGEGMEAEVLFAFCVGLIVVEKNDERYIPCLVRWLMDADWTGFLLAFIPTDEYLQAFASSEVFSQESLKKMMKARGEDLDSRQKYFDALSLDDKIKHVSAPTFENGCWQLIEYLDFLAAILICNHKYDLLAERIAYYTLPEIQYALLSSIKDPDDVVKLFKVVGLNSSFASDQKRVILQLILNHWLQNLIRIKSDYAIPLPAAGRNERLQEIWNEMQTQFEDNLADMMKDSLSMFLQVLSPKELSQWLFSVHMPTTLIENEQTNAIRQVLGSAKKILISLTRSNGFDKDIRDLAYLDSYAQNIGKIEDSQVTQLAEAILESLFSDHKYLWGNVSDDLLSRIHTLSIAIRDGLGKEAGEIFKLYMDRFQVRYEGIRPTPLSERNELCFIENQILMVLLYMTTLNEVDDVKKFDFNIILQHLLKQTKAAEMSGLDVSHNLRTLVLSELIVSQVLPELKEEFESECIRLCPNFSLLLKVFNCSKGAVSSHACRWLQCQYESEWPIIKNRMVCRNQHKDVQWLEEVYYEVVSRC